MREWVAAPFLFIRGGVICSVFFWLPIRQGGAGNVFIRRTRMAGARFPRSVTFGASPQGAKKWKAVCAAAFKSEKKRRVVSPASIFDNLATAHLSRRLPGVSSFRLMERAFQFAP